jgi:hypothetical protein
LYQKAMKLWQKCSAIVLLLAPATPIPVSAEDFQGATHKLDYESAPIHYNDGVHADAVAALQQRLISKETTLSWDEKFGYLPALLKAFGIPPESQALVFSKTSLQRGHISPANPRSLFFNDTVYIGYIPGAPLMEISTADPKLGGVFYSLENEKVKVPRFTRELDCLRCHGAQRTLGVPDHFLRSIGTDASGELDPQTEVSEIDQCTPLSDR